MNSTAQPEHFRLFVAIQIPEQIKGELQRAQDQLRRAVLESSLRWTNPAQMHLTLRFLGNVDAARVNSLVETLPRACSSFAPLQLSAESVGFFPNARRPRVIWAGVREATGALGALQQAIQTATYEYTTEPAENKFVGHLTLARIKLLRPPEVQSLARTADAFATRCFGAWTATRVDLIRSQLSSTGAQYTILAGIPLSP